MTELTCFKAYDIRGIVGIDINEEICYSIGRAIAQHFNARKVAIGFDARETSPNYAKAIAEGVMDQGSDVLDIGLSGTEEMYWAVSEFGTCAGIEVTASHNPINFNGMKIVKSGSCPLDSKKDLQAIKDLAELRSWRKIRSKGTLIDCHLKARKAFISRIMRFIDVDTIKPLKIVVNSGNGAAGPTLDAIEKKLSDLNAPLKFVKINHTPDHNFPNGIPNPLLVENQEETGRIVRVERADFGIAFDGDFDRCFFFDEHGQFLQSEYIIGLLASLFLEKAPGSKIVHDPRIIWNIEDIISLKGGFGILSKTGHVLIKQIMRNHKAIYGGEISAHHYFADFAYCDSGMIPWLLITELVSKSGRSLGDLVSDQFRKFPSSGEINFLIEDPTTAIKKVVDRLKDDATSIDKTDGISMSFKDWRFNLRSSNTEPLVRLNIESKGNRSLVNQKVDFIGHLLKESMAD